MSETWRQCDGENILVVKKVEATIPASVLEEVAHLLPEVDAYALTTADVRSFGRPDGRRDRNRGSAHDLDGLPTVQVEMVVHDETVPAIVAAIRRCTRRRRGDEGQVLIATVSEVIPIPAGEPSKSRL
jgi:nitrogen regulatory protein PII